MLPPYYFYWFRIDNKHMTEPWLDQALMDSAYRSGLLNLNIYLFRMVLANPYIASRRGKQDENWSSKVFSG